MACNTCTKSFTFLRKEKACPACGFSYCSTCLNNKVFVKKVNSEAKVCAKCKNTVNSEETLRIQPPDAYYKRIGIKNPQPQNNTGEQGTNESVHPTDDEIQQRLQKLKTNPTIIPQTSDKEIAERLKQIKGEIPTTSNAEIEERLLKLRNLQPTSSMNDKPALPAADLRTEQEQVDDLMKQYLQQTKIDAQYKDEFDNVIGNIETRLGNLKGSNDGKNVEINEETKDEEELVKNILKKYKAEASLEIQESVTETDSEELPFCEICNEDATMRCLGCKYLFCRRCYLEHRDDDDGCNKYEPYKPPKGVKY